ncbi:MAG: class I SAM-dependent methyltransferase [Candidatus Micrarchaeia archaeon]
MGYLKVAERYREKKGLLSRWITYLLERKAVSQIGQKNHYAVFLKFFIDRYCNKPGLSVVEIGPGDGWALSLMDRRIKEKIAVDIDATYRKKLEAKGIVFCQADVRKKIPLAKNSVDVLILNHVLEHLDDPVSVLKGLHSRLKRDGIIIIRTPDIEKVGFSFWSDPTHVKPFTRLSLRQALEISGFKTVVCESFSYRMFMLSYLLPGGPFLPGNGSELLYVGKK